MKLFHLSLTLGILSNIVLSALTRSWWPLAEMSPGIQRLVTLLLLILAVTGTVLGVMSWNRKEVRAWWAFVALMLNIVMALAGIVLLLAG